MTEFTCCGEVILESKRNYFLISEVFVTKAKIVILFMLFILIPSGVALCKDLSPVQLQAVLQKAQEQEFDARDISNNRIESKKIQSNIAGVFRLVERLQNLRAQIEIPTIYGAILQQNNLVLNSGDVKKSNLHIPLAGAKHAETVFTIIRNKKQMVSSLPAHVSAGGTPLLIVSFLMFALGIFTFKDEPRFRFTVKLE